MSTQANEEVKPPVEKKVDESFKQAVEAEKQASEQAKVLKLEDVIKGIDWSKGKATEIAEHEQVIILAYNPVERGLQIRAVRNVAGYTDNLNIFRDCVFQLEQMEISRNNLANNAMLVRDIVRDEFAKFFAMLTSKK